MKEKELKSGHILVQLVSDLTALTFKIKAGKKGIDFAIESDDDGIDQYKYTPVELKFMKITREIDELIKLHPDILTVSLYKLINSAFKDSSPAVTGFRGRTPAFGGDWQDIDSLIKHRIKETGQVLYETAKQLKENGHEEFKDLDDDVIKDMKR